MYKPGCSDTNKPNPFENAERFVIVQYIFNDFTLVIPPSTKIRIYPSVKEKVKSNLAKGFGPKRAVFSVENEVGGVLNAVNQSVLPSIKNAYNQSSKQKSAKQAPDPLLQLIKEQHEDNTNGVPVIRKVLSDENSYTILLYTDRILNNIANFCCTQNSKFKSAFNLDFTFDLFQNPPCFALITSYSNTSVQTKRAPHKSPELLGPILITHFRSENVVKTLFDAMLHDCPGLKAFLQVVGADGERSLTNAALNTFERALLLLCYKHEKDNVTTACNKLKLSESNKKGIINDICGSSFETGLLDCCSFQDYDAKVKELTTKWNKDEETKKFAAYFAKNKQDEFKYHVCSAAVNNAEVCDLRNKFYNNGCESKNNLIKCWQNYGKVDLLQFKKSYVEITSCEENNVAKAFLGLEGPYTVREEFAHLCKSYSEFRSCDRTEMEEFKKKCTNTIVDVDAYKSVKEYDIGRLVRKER